MSKKNILTESILNEIDRTNIMSDSDVKFICNLFSERQNQEYKIEGNEAIYDDGTIIKFIVNDDDDIEYYIINKQGDKSATALVIDSSLIDNVTEEPLNEAASKIEEQKQEALERMEMLKLSRNCINAFKSGKVWESEGIGALYEVNDEEQKIIDEFESKYNGLVYHMIHNLFEFGEVYSIFYVSQYKNEWKQDREDLADGYAMVYAYNKDNPMFSEFGSIAFKSNIGGLVRTS